MSNKRRPKKLTSLWSITQGPNETFESYIARFTTTYSCVANLDKDFSIHAFTTGVNNENVQYAFCGVDVTSMEGLIGKAHKLFNTQETSHSQTP